MDVISSSCSFEGESAHSFQMEETSNFETERLHSMHQTNSHFKEEKIHSFHMEESSSSFHREERIEESSDNLVQKRAHSIADTSRSSSFEEKRVEKSKVRESQSSTEIQQIEIATVSKNIKLPEPVGYIVSSVPSRPPPNDRFYLIWLVFILNSGGFWLAWNLMNFLGPTYYFDYWFSTKFHIPIVKPHSYGTDFLNALGMLACSPLFALGYVALIPIPRIPILCKYLAGLAVYTVCVLILFIATCSWKTPSQKPGDVGSFFAFSVIIILIMMGAVGAYQSFLYGMAANFPRIYTSAIVIGTNLGGIFASLMYTLINPKAYSKFKLELQTAEAFYGIAFGYLILCLGSVFIFWKSEFYHYFMEENYCPLLDKRNTVDEQPAQRFSRARRFLRNFGEVFSIAWVELLGIFMIFFTMYAIFPTLSVGIEPASDQGNPAKVPEYFLPIGTFLNFYTFATLGAVASMFIEFPTHSKKLRVFLLIPCYLSMYLILFFMFCNFYPSNGKQRTAKVVFKGEWFFFIGNGFLGVLTGFLSGILMPLASRVVKPELRQLAGQMALASLLTGLYLGAGMTPGFISALTLEAS